MSLTRAVTIVITLLPWATRVLRVRQPPQPIAPSVLDRVPTPKWRNRQGPKGKRGLPLEKILHHA